VAGINHPSQRGKVLVVDDDHLALQVIRGRLERAGFTVITRHEAIGTSAAVVTEKPDVILLDFRMPGLSGDALAQLLEKNESTRHIGIIFHSGEDLALLQRRAKELGLLGAIPKTDSEPAFLAQFERLFARAKEHRR
jgi:two-component system phosphate regulon response regulator PhoB